MPETVIAQIKIRSDTADKWQTVNPVLATGELGFDTTNNQIRIGNMGLPWNSLTPINTGFTYTTVTNTSTNINTGNTPNNQDQQTYPSSSTPQPTTNISSSLIIYNDNIRRTSSSYEPAYIRLYNLFIKNNNITNNLDIYPYNVSVFDHVILYSHLKISQADPVYNAFTLSLLKNIVDDSIIIVGQDRSAQFTSLFINNALIWDTNVNSVILSYSGPDIINLYDRMVHLVKHLRNEDISEYLNEINAVYQLACINKVVDIFIKSFAVDPNSDFSLLFGTLENTTMLVQLVQQNARNIAMSYGF